MSGEPEKLPSVNPQFAAQHIAKLLDGDPVMARLVKEFISAPRILELLELHEDFKGTDHGVMRVVHDVPSTHSSRNDITLELMRSPGHHPAFKIKVIRRELEEACQSLEQSHSLYHRHQGALLDVRITSGTK